MKITIAACEEKNKIVFRGLKQEKSPNDQWVPQEKVVFLICSHCIRPRAGGGLEVSCLLNKADSPLTTTLILRVTLT